MAKNKRPRDANQLANHVVEEATGQAETDSPEVAKSAAAELGRRGGLRGGKARAAKLTPEQRSQIAKKAAQSRWRRPDREPPAGS